MKQNRTWLAAQDVKSFVFAQETVLFRESSQAFCRLNETASLIWCLFEAGHDPAAIATRLIEDHALEQQRADSYVRAVMEDLAGNGFLGEAPRAGTLRGVGQQAVLQAANWREPEAELRWHSRFRIHNLVVDVGADDRDCLELVNRTFAFLRAETDRQSDTEVVGVSIQRSGQARYVVRYAETTVRDCTLDQVPPLVHAAFFLRYYEQNFRFLAFHSAAVCSDSGLVLLPGTSGSGKSTLTAALVTCGFRHVTDELLLLDLPGDSLLGAPLAIGLKRGSWKLGAGLFAQIQDLPAFRRQDGRAVKYLSPPALCRDYGLRGVRAMVFPALAPDERVSVQSLSVPETFFRLTEAGYDAHCTLSREHVSALFEWLGAIPAFELRYRNLERAVEEITRLCEG